jgi:hypothetical protein
MRILTLDSLFSKRLASTLRRDSFQQAARKPRTVGVAVAFAIAGSIIWYKQTASVNTVLCQANLLDVNYSK